MSSRLIGYTRPLPGDDDPLQDAERLVAAGAAVVLSEAAGTPSRSRPVLAECEAQLSAGDTLVVSSAVRLSHSVNHFVSTARALADQGVQVRVLEEPSLTTKGTHDSAETFRALDDLRHRLLSLRTQEGLMRASQRGRNPGRPTVMTAERLAVAAELRAQGRTMTHIARAIGVSPSAVRRALTPDGGRAARTDGAG